MNIRRYYISTTERRQYTPFFKFKSTNINLLSCLFCLLDKNGRLCIMIAQMPVNQTPCEGSISDWLFYLEGGTILHFAH